MQQERSERCEVMKPNPVGFAQTIPEGRERLLRGLLLDWDGCLALGPDFRPGAASLLERYRGNCIIISNNSTHRSEDLLERLAAIGVAIDPSLLLVAGEETLGKARALRPSNPLIFANENMRALAGSMGLKSRDDRPADLVVLLRDTEWTYDKLSRAVAALAHGARLLVSNPDLYHPGVNGIPVPETGALLASIRACVELDPNRMDIVGKPSAVMFQKACERLSLHPAECLMVGDNLETDIAGAQRFGMPALHIRPDEASWADKIYAHVSPTLPAKTV